MKILITAKGDNLEAKFDQRFARADYLLLIDGDTKKVIEAKKNPWVQMAHGVGVKAANYILNEGIDVVISGSFGPNAYEILKEGNCKLYTANKETCKEILDSYFNNELIEFKQN